MKKIEVVSASAGSGKTTRVASELRRRIEQGGVRPEAVLATTFTNKAADELKERARTELFRAGLVDEALRLEGARIGTVNSVCGRLVTDFALELGLSPELRVIDEDQAAVALRRVISRVVTQHEREELTLLAARFDEFSWQHDVERLLVLARTNLLTEAQLRESGRRSAEQLLSYLPPAVGDALARDAEFAAALERARKAIDPTDDTGTTKEATGKIDAALAALSTGPAAWKLWGKIKHAHAGKKSRAALAIAQDVAGEVDTHPRLHADLARVIELVFEITARVMEHWQDEKRELGVLDFVDQETRALELLHRPEFTERLAAQLDLVLIDEFQDTSPLQLQLFTRLAALAKASVWVGDQKQAIFGFRGTDPALMDAAIDAVLGGKDPETLKLSYRSRRSLVDLTSSLFAKAFAAHGLPEQRVRLETPSPDDARLGAPVEAWKLLGKNRDQHLGALAEGVVGFLADPEARVRDRVDGSVRRPRAGDVAVLCRRNRDCQALAAVLSRRGVSATVRQAGLMHTPEARAAVLALRLFIDPRERLAAGELARLLLHPDDPDGWLDVALSRQPDELAFASAKFHQSLEDARARFPSAGPLAALEAAIDGLGLIELLPRWGDSARRLANLDALRGHAVDYVARADAEGSAATPAGLVAWLEVLEEELLDAQARLPGAESVVISTWHAAKGLEWPVTVLALVGRDRPVPRFGFSVRSTRKGFTLETPLEGRWVRYWPNPFHASQTTELRANLEAAPEAAAEQAESDKQELRLLYVGWTRARDRLVLALADGGWMLGHLEAQPEGSGEVEWCGQKVTLTRRELEERGGEAPEPAPDEAVVLRGPLEHPPAFVSPSNLEGDAVSVSVTALGERLQVTGELEPTAFGQALHGFFAADRPSLPRDERLKLAREALLAWEQTGTIRPDRMVDRSDALRAWAEQVAPGARWHAELAVSDVRADGGVLRGVADLVLERDDGFWLVDHKSFPGNEANGVEKAKTFAGQLEAYAGALAAAWGKPCRGKFIHLVTLGRVVELG